MLIATVSFVRTRQNDTPYSLARSSVEQRSVSAIHRSNPPFDAADNAVFHGAVGIDPVIADRIFAIEKDRNFTIGPSVLSLIERGQGVAIPHRLARPFIFGAIKRPVAIEIGHALDQPLARFDVGKFIDDEFERKGLNIDIFANTSDLRHSPPVA